MVVTWIFLAVAILLPISSLIALLPIAVEQTRRRREAARETITVHLRDDEWDGDR